MIFPRSLPRGGTIGICSPAGPVKQERMLRAVDAIRFEGYQVVLSENALGNVGLFSASDEVRARELVEMFTRDDIDTVFCARGGVGSSRLLSFLDTDSIAKSQKPFLGFSDITALQWLLYARHGYISYSGPLAVEWDDALSEITRARCWQVLAGKFGESLWDGFTTSPAILRGELSSVVVGPVLAGNLTMITTLLGTQYFPELQSAILIMEDVSEPPYRVDRMLFHLKNAGVFEKIGALLVGDFSVDSEPGSEWLESSVLDATAGTRFPIVTGLAYGHGRERMTIPVGAVAELKLSPLSFRVSQQQIASEVL